jgi:hypothetical protein
MTTLARYAKATAAAVGVALTLIVAYGPAVVGALPADSQVTRVLAALLAVATVIVVRAVPNARTLNEAKTDMAKAVQRRADVGSVTVYANGSDVTKPPGLLPPMPETAYPPGSVPLPKTLTDWPPQDSDG